MDIVRAEIKNFQSHENTKINFEDGINVFVGTSDSGKSAILRALKWNLTNSPSGKEFIKEGTQEASVKVYFKDGHAVERTRNKGSKNTYALFKDDVVLKEYTGFGSNVPQDILDVTRINPDFQFNFANQLEAPFLLSETPKVRAETIGNLEELGKIDAELGTLNEDVRDTKRDQKSTQLKMKGIEAERTQLLAELNVSRVKVETIEQLKEAIIEKSRIYEGIKQSGGRIRLLEDEIVQVKEVLERAMRILDAWDDRMADRIQDLNRLTTLITRLLQMKNEAAVIKFMNEDKLEQLIHLSSYTTELVASYQRLVQLKTRLESNIHETKTTKENYSEKVSAIDMSGLDAEVLRFNALFTQKQRLKDVEVTEQQLNERVDVSKKEIDRLLLELLDALHDAETCPVCMQSTEKITEKQIAHSI